MFLFYCSRFPLQLIHIISGHHCVSANFLLVICITESLTSLFGNIRSNLLCICRPHNFIAGDLFVAGCIARRYANNIRSIFLCNSSLRGIAFNLVLNVCINRSALPLVAGWYGAPNLCVISFCLKNS